MADAVRWRRIEGVLRSVALILVHLDGRGREEEGRWKAHCCFLMHVLAKRP